MFDFLKRPHPFIFNIYSVIIPSVITFVIIVIFAPFQFQEFTITYRILSGLFIALIVGLSILFSFKALKKLFPNILLEDRWTIGKEFVFILLTVIIISLLISITLVILPTEETSFTSLFFKTTLITVAISIFPILISILFEQYRHQKIQLKKVTELTEALKVRTTNESLKLTGKNPLEESIIIESEKGEVELKLNPNDLLYVNSDGNYIEVNFLNSNQLQKKLIRNRLKNMEALLPSTIFFRCHNSFIVNGNHIIKVEGNARNLILHLRGVVETIPVSRTKAKTISSFLKKLQ